MRGRKIDDERGVEWIGCDRSNVCGKWFHYHCLSYDERTAVDMSIVVGGEWLCNECSVVHGQDIVPCPVCMRDIRMNETDPGSVAVCSQCAGLCHLFCLSEPRQIEYHMYLQRGGNWMCNQCSMEE